MKYLAAYSLLVLGGNEHPTADQIEKFMKDSGIKSDRGRIDQLLAAMDGRSFQEMVDGGLAKMATFNVASAAPVAPVEVPKVIEDVKKEEPVDPGMDGGFGGLFDSDGEEDY